MTDTDRHAALITKAIEAVNDLPMADSPYNVRRISVIRILELARIDALTLDPRLLANFESTDQPRPASDTALREAAQAFVDSVRPWDYDAPQFDTSALAALRAALEAER